MKTGFFLLPLSLAMCFLGLGAMADAENATPPCAFEVSKVEQRYAYYTDFAITITNKSDQPAVIQYHDGAPFEILFVSDGKTFVLRHKSDEYAIEHGASRKPKLVEIRPGGTTCFYVDIKGDCVVVKSGRPQPFRDFAAGKEGTITIKPLDMNQGLFPKAGSHRLIKWDGKSIVLP